MSKIIYGADITLDGVVEGPDKWRFDYMSKDLQAYDMQKINSLDTMLLGRNTYQGFASFWPSQKHNEFGIADKLNNTPKYVVSTTLKNAEWNNSTVISKNILEEIKKLKAGTGGDIGITGSVTLTQFLMHHNLIDEYDLLIFPLVVGSGKRLFNEGTSMRLELIESKAFGTGPILFRFEPAGEKNPQENRRL